MIGSPILVSPPSSGATAATGPVAKADAAIIKPTIKKHVVLIIFTPPKCHLT
jgi:hypothetical protein